MLARNSAALILLAGDVMKYDLGRGAKVRYISRFS